MVGSVRQLPPPPRPIQSLGQLERLHCSMPVEGLSGLTAVEMGSRETWGKGFGMRRDKDTLSLEEESVKGDLEDTS